jgi:hypothetical protein
LILSSNQAKLIYSFLLVFPLSIKRQPQNSSFFGSNLYSQFSNKSNKLSLPESLNIFSSPLSDIYVILPPEPEPSDPITARADI